MGRMEKVNELIKREISSLLRQEFEDPKLEFVTITGVVVSRDLQHARVNFSFLGDPGQVAEVERSLKAIRGHLRKLLAKRVRLRQVPELQFFYDDSIQYGAKIEQTLKDIEGQKGAHEFPNNPQDD